jgi:serine/threonine protein kinase KIN1/2
VTDPKQRASLQEIMNHPWMVKGFGTPPENYLPVREPLQLPLDPTVVQAMTGFDFGSPETISAQLTEVLESAEYQRAVRLASHEKEVAAPQKDAEKKRGFGFDFYKRRSSTTSRDTLSAPSSEALALGSDPVNAFHPLISVYYLVREKQDRDRLLANPGATSMPRTPGEAPLQMTTDIPAPKPAHTNAATYEMAGEKPTGGRSRPRARTHGEEEVVETLKNTKGPSGPTSPAIVEPPPETPRKESGAAGFLRRLSTRRRKEPNEKSHPPLVHVQSPAEPHTLRKSFSVRRTRERTTDGPPSSMLRSGSSQPQHSDLLTPPGSSDNTRSAKGLGRSTSVNSADFRRKENRRGGSEAPPPRVTYKEPPPTSGSDHSTVNEKLARDGDQQKTLLNPRSATTRAKSLGHARRESIQARRARREEVREANVPEETDVEVGDASGLSTERIDNAENAKPVFLKGLFSVSTTSTKPVQVIRADIIRVLKQLGVEYTEIRGGFSCRHTPSIDLKKVVDLPPSSHGNQTPGHKRRISFGGFMGGGNSNSLDREREDFREAEKSPQTPRTPGRTQTRGGPDNSLTNSDASDESVNGHHRGSSARAVGETSTHVQSELGGSMILEFEIFIVKVPLLSLHGIQFKRLAGGTWQYKNMADQILRELRL